MDTVLQDLRHALATLARMRGVAAVAIATLALGIGATTTMFSVVYAALLRPPPFAEPDRLAMLYVTRTTPRDGLVRLRWSRPVIAVLESMVRSRTAVESSPPAPGADRHEPPGPSRARDEREGAAPAGLSSFEAIASVTGASVALSGGSDVPEQIDGELVSAGYFSTLRTAPGAGRTFRPDEDNAPGAHPIAIVSDRLWRRRFAADPSLIGGIIRVSDVPLTVIGIAPPGFLGLTGKADLWMPRTMAPTLTYSDYLVTPQHFISVVARLRPGVTLDQANAELAAIGPRFADAVSADAPPTTWSAAARALREARVDPTLRQSVLVLLAAAGCVLLISCVNVAGLMLARARTRRREIAIRLAIGSSRRRLVQQLLTEGFVIAAIAGVCGTVLAAWGVALFARTAPEVIASGGNDYAAVASFAAPVLDFRVLLFATAVSLGTTMVFALAPAMEASRPDLVSALKEDDRGGRRGRALAGLVVSEVAVAVLLLAGAGLLLESFTRMQNLRRGFTAERVLTFWIRPPNSRYAPADGPAIVARMLARIEQTPGVESAAVNRCTPFIGCARTTVFFPGQPVDRVNAPGVGRHYVSADYFRTLGIPLLAGRSLAVDDRAGRPPVAVVNETGARRFWPGENPIGKRVWFGTTTGPFADPGHAVEIVGVVGDVPYEAVGHPDFTREDRADFYTSYLQFTYPDTIVIVKTRGPAEAVVPSLRSAVASVDSAVPIFDVMLLDERIGRALARPRFNATIVAAFAAAALLLAALGVYGVLSYSVSSRMREIGVRLALGAGAGRVITLVLGEGLRLAAIGAAIGVAGAIAVMRLLQGLLVGVAPSDPRILAAGAITMLAVACAAAWLPARRASAVDPIVVLREP
jgi:predicted permease